MQDDISPSRYESRTYRVHAMLSLRLFPERHGMHCNSAGHHALSACITGAYGDVTAYKVLLVVVRAGSDYRYIL